jgi:hypothetical protein
MYKLGENCIIKLDGTKFVLSIPLAEDNTDYQTYLKWLADGNTPLPAENA